MAKAGAVTGDGGDMAELRNGSVGLDGGDGENGCERKGVEMGNRREMERQRERRPWFPMRWICNTVLETDNINCLSFTMHGNLEFEL